MRLFVRGLAVATSLALAANFSPLTTASAEVPGALTTDACAVDQKPLQFLSMNDFHGRVDTYKDLTVKFFGAVEELRAGFGESRSVVISAGDNWGGSLFTSSAAREKPAMDVLNAAQIDASSPGNHEFDRGWGFLKEEAMGQLKFPMVASNVYLRGTKTPALPEYAIVERDGVKIMIIGAVTPETPTLVSPDNVKDLEFGSMREAVNRVVAEHGSKADVIVAALHDGTFPGEESTTYDKAVAADANFKDMNNLDPRVSVIFNGHTHQSYAWMGTAPDGSKRPVVSAKQYAERVGQTVLCLTADKKVASAHAKIVPTSTSSSADLAAKFPRVAAIKAITDKAVAEADVIGLQKVSCAKAAVTRARVEGAEARGKESVLTNTVANMFRDKISAATGKSVIGVQNPGGTRADLDAGDISYKKAASVLPFANMLQYTSITGAEFKTMLEQQWQPGTPPRFLHLGLSDNVQWTYDTSRPVGDRVTSITIDGKPITAGASYNVGSGNFLLAGGDNFTVFSSKTKVDTGLVDLDAWTDWLKARAADCLVPNFSKKAIDVSPMPTTIGPKGTTLTLREVDFASVGAPKNTAVTATATLGGYSFVLGKADVVNGQATLTLVNRFGYPRGKTVVRLTFEGTGTVLNLPVTLS